MRSQDREVHCAVKTVTRRGEVNQEDRLGFAPLYLTDTDNMALYNSVLCNLFMSGQGG